MADENDPSGGSATGDSLISFVRESSSEGSGLDFHHFASLVEGAGLISVNFFSEDGSVTLGFSAGRDVNIRPSKGGFGLQLDAKPEGHYSAPVPISFEGATSAHVGASVAVLAAIDELYAIIFLRFEDRWDALRNYLKTSEAGHASALLKDSERPVFLSFAYGSWHSEMWSKTKNGIKALRMIALSASGRGREAMIRRVEAEACLGEANAKKVNAEARKINAEAVAQEVKAMGDLTDFYEKEIVKLDKSNPIRLKFEAQFLVIEDFSKEEDSKMKDR